MLKVGLFYLPVISPRRIQSTLRSQSHISDAYLYLKALFANQIFYATCIATIKFSILLMYRRIFPTKKFSVATYVVGTVVAARCIAVILVSIFTCALV